MNPVKGAEVPRASHEEHWKGGRAGGAGQDAFSGSSLPAAGVLCQEPNFNIGAKNHPRDENAHAGGGLPDNEYGPFSVGRSVTAAESPGTEHRTAELAASQSSGTGGCGGGQILFHPGAEGSTKRGQGRAEAGERMGSILRPSQSWRPPAPPVSGIANKEQKDGDAAPPNEESRKGKKGKKGKGRGRW